MRRVLPAATRVLVQALGAVLLAAAVSGVWSAAASRGFTETLSLTLYLGAALWLFGGGALAMRLTKLEHQQWGVGVPTDGAREEGGRGSQPAPIELTPLGSSLVVAVLLVALGMALH